MSANKTYFVYNTNQPLSAEEKQLVALGFPFVSTTKLLPGGRLNQHQHSSKNTHLIVQGSIIIGKIRSNDLELRPKEYGAGDIAPMPADVDYVGEAGSAGCVFVEGHLMLSPTTAQRFEERGTIVRARKNAVGAFSTAA